MQIETSAYVAILWEWTVSALRWRFFRWGLRWQRAHRGAFPGESMVGWA